MSEIEKVKITVTLPKDLMEKVRETFIRSRGDLSNAVENGLKLLLENQKEVEKT